MGALASAGERPGRGHARRGPQWQLLWHAQRLITLCAILLVTNGTATGSLAEGHSPASGSREPGLGYPGECRACQPHWQWGQLEVPTIIRTTARALA